MHHISIPVTRHAHRVISQTYGHDDGVIRARTNNWFGSLVRMTFTDAPVLDDLVRSDRSEVFYQPEINDDYPVLLKVQTSRGVVQWYSSSLCQSRSKMNFLSEFIEQHFREIFYHRVNVLVSSGIKVLPACKKFCSDFNIDPDEISLESLRIMYYRRISGK